MKRFLTISILFMVILSFNSCKRPEVIVRFNPQYKETVYSINENNCQISWTIYKSEINKGVVRHRSNCNLPFKDQIPLLSKILDRVLKDNDRNSIHTLYMGRLIYSFGKDNSEMAQRLALGAKKSSLWDAEKGMPISGHENTFVKNLANEKIIYWELKKLFEKYNLSIKVKAVEKVLIKRGDKLPFGDWLKMQGVKDTDKLPFDCMIWFSISRIEK